jgi:ribosomal protein S18 acetylase RimI-like enzyme
MSYRIRAATTSDVEAMRALLPRLAAFDLPPRRAPEDLWRGDEEMLLGWQRGEEPELMAHLAVDEADSVLGVVVVRLGDELLSHEPSAHLEVLAVAQGMEGRGIGKALIDEAERSARECGARSMTLHVFGKNTRARRIYERLGYDGELIRYIKGLVD